jgi:hypothetical protein
MTDRDFSILFLLVVGPLLLVVVLGRDIIVTRNWCVQDLRKMLKAKEAIARIGIIIAVYYVLVVLGFFNRHFMPHIHIVPALIYVITIPATFGLLSSCRWLRIIAVIIMALSSSLFVSACIMKSLHFWYLE